MELADVAWGEEWLWLGDGMGGGSSLSDDNFGVTFLRITWNNLIFLPYSGVKISVEQEKVSGVNV